MISKYLSRLDAVISMHEAIAEIDIVRKDIRDTGLEKTALYRYRLKLRDGSLLELTERIVEEKGRMRVTKFRFHWQDRFGSLIKRWDNAPHHPEIETFPNHLHDGSEDNVIKYKQCNALKILQGIIGKTAMDNERSCRIGE